MKDQTEELAKADRAFNNIYVENAKLRNRIGRAEKVLLSAGIGRDWRRIIDQAVLVLRGDDK